MNQWTPFSRQAWAVRVVLLASAAVVIFDIGAWVVSLLLLVLMLGFLIAVWPGIRRR
jgi:hypothetical protein